MTHDADPIPFQSSKSGPLMGEASIPGDKSVSHRSLMFGGIAKGKTIIHGLLEGEDVLNTAAAMRAMGATIEHNADGTWSATGTGVGNLKSPAAPMEMGNSGTSTRLLAGLVAGHPITASFTGDASLSKRPMGRVINPLTDMGASFKAQEGGMLPMTVTGAATPKAITYKLPVASAQVKSAVLLAGLRSDSVTTVIEEKPTRDHSENMLRHFGVVVDVEDLANGAQAIHLKGGQQMIAGINVLRLLPVLPDGKQVDFGPILEAVGENIYGPRLGSRILIDKRNQLTIPQEHEKDIMTGGVGGPVHPMGRQWPTSASRSMDRSRACPTVLRDWRDSRPGAHSGCGRAFPK